MAVTVTAHRGLPGNHDSQVCPIPPDNGQACSSSQGPTYSGQRSPEIFCQETNCSVLERTDPGSPLFSLEVPACGPSDPATALTLGPVRPGQPAFRFVGASSHAHVFTSLLASGSPDV